MADSLISEDETDPQRRRLLLAATTGMGALGVAAVAVPFIESMQPSEAAKAAGAPVEVDISNIGPGKLQTAEWRGKPVWILHRTDAMVAELSKLDARLADRAS
jgi:ubiquinol-cytochrome c reductase iron-sulfur subunit